MKKLLLLGVCVCCIQLLTAQESLVEFENSLKNSNSSIKDVIPIINDDTNDIAVFFADAKNVYGYLFNDTFELQKKLLSPEKRRKYKVLIGSSILLDGSYRVFLTNKGHNRFSSMTLSFDKKEPQLHEFNLEDTNERFIQTITYKNKFYLLSAARRAPEDHAYNEGIYIYTFDDEGKPKRNTIDIRSFVFLDKKGNAISIPSLVAPYANSIKKIENNVPNSIEVAASNRKMYTQDNKVILSFDNNKEFSQFLEINIETLEANKKSFEKPMKGIEKNRKKTNSYLNGDLLFMVAATKDNFTFQVHSFKTNSVIKKYNFSQEDTIHFKNTPIIQEGGMYDNLRELESSKKFLRKITAQKIGVSAIKVLDMYHLTIGGYVEQKSGGMMPMGGFGIPMASFGNVNMFFNPTMFAYGSMSNTKSTRIECLFDEDFDHLGGDIPENAFDKIDSFVSKEIGEGETIFSYKDYFIFLDYQPVSKNHVLRKFKE